MKLFGGSSHSKHSGSHDYGSGGRYETEDEPFLLQDREPDGVSSPLDETRAVPVEGVSEELWRESRTSAPRGGSGGNTRGNSRGGPGGSSRGSAGGSSRGGSGGNARGGSGGSGRGNAPKKKKKGGSGIPTWGKIVIVVFSVLLILTLSAFIWIMTHREPPETTKGLNTFGSSDDTGGGAAPGTTPDTTPDTAADTATDTTPDTADDTAPTTGRRENTYTFLVVGKDKVGSNTDAIMVAMLDTESYKLNVVSIPRDTYVNTTYKNKRVNSLYGSGGADGLMDNITNFIGYRPDGYAIVDLNAFMKLVNAIGGVDYYVPRDIDYDDEFQDLHIHFKKGMTHMTGQKAMEYVRFRKGYADADIGRIDAQHEFLLTAAKQILANRSSVPLTTLVNIVVSDVKTSLDLGQCTWLAGELLKLDAENIQFFTMPGKYNDYYNGKNYVTVDIDGWIEMLNTYLNPFYEQITTANVDLAGRNASGKMIATSGKLH